ncbi:MULTISPECIES: hypothetical protein [Flavobacterium]|jgi:hypothetical protein|uniref:Uncharacterized protein n=1 Tax=Flavobacterium cheniae TaxID=295428 RepID=A0A562KCV5_9FLAO|nr:MULTISPECIES: hypothetical protein [Flavobacterium]TDR25257.1 hypothetical protein C8D80_0023 [Flavobacterium cheniae]TWH93045.1 hypothetical protein IP97_02114 [Flavobacterium cheniae]
MENIATDIELLYKKAEKYSKTSFELLQLNTIDKTSDVISSLSVVISISIIVAMFTLFINIGISLFIGKLLNDYAMGFFLVSGFYFIVAIIVFIFRKTLIKIPIDNLIVSKLLKDKIISEDESNPNHL